MTALRSNLLATLGVPSFYDLDRLDLSVTATLDNAVQQAVSERLASAATRDGAQAAGLCRLRHAARVRTIRRRSPIASRCSSARDGANLVRVQTDSVNQPFDINSRRAPESRLDGEAAYGDHLSADRLRRCTRAMRR